MAQRIAELFERVLARRHPDLVVVRSKNVSAVSLTPEAIGKAMEEIRRRKGDIEELEHAARNRLVDKILDTAMEVARKKEAEVRLSVEREKKGLAHVGVEFY